MMLEVSAAELLGALRGVNPWWQGDGVAAAGAGRWQSARLALDRLVRLIGDDVERRPLVLAGARRVGKSVLLVQALEHLRRRGVAPGRLFYLPLAHPVAAGHSPDQLIELWQGEQPLPRHQRGYLFLDDLHERATEPQQLQGLLLALAERWPALRLIAATTVLPPAPAEGEGEAPLITLPLAPLSFADYLRLIGRESQLILSGDIGGPLGLRAPLMAELNQAFIAYLNHGGFPEAVTAADGLGLIRSELLEHLLRGHPVGRQELLRLVALLACHSGAELGPERLGPALGLNRKAAIRLLDQLAGAGLTQGLRRLGEQGKPGGKLFLAHPCLRAALYGPVAEDQEPAVARAAEAALIGQLPPGPGRERLRYADGRKPGSRKPAPEGTGGRADLIHCAPRPGQAEGVPDGAVWVTWSDQVAEQHDLLKDFVAFCYEHGIKDPVVTTRTVAQRQNVLGLTVDFRPSALFCYQLGKYPPALKGACPWADPERLL